MLLARYDRRASLVDNVDSLLGCGWDMFEALGLRDGLDVSGLSASSSVPNALPTQGWGIEGLYFRTSSGKPKRKELPAVFENCQRANRAVGSGTGRRRVRCLLRTACLGKEVPVTRTMRFQGCRAASDGDEESHYACSRCVASKLMSSSSSSPALQALPEVVCPAAWCCGRVHPDAVARLAEGVVDVEVARRQRALEDPEADPKSEQRLLECPNPECGHRNGLADHLREHGVTHCRACRWCANCRVWRALGARGDFNNQGCPFALGQFYMANKSCRKDLVSEFGLCETRKAILSYKRQVQLVNNSTPCQNCETPKRENGSDRTTTCGCGSVFCFQCSLPLDSATPYGHFVRSPECQPYYWHI